MQNERCTHRHTTFIGKRIHFGDPCERTSVPAGRYETHRCRDCKARVEIALLDGKRYAYRREDLSERDAPAVRPSNPEVYEPHFDGVDATTALEREPIRSGLFDRRGGSGGVGESDLPEGVESC